MYDSPHSQYVRRAAAIIMIMNRRGLVPEGAVNLRRGGSGGGSSVLRLLPLLLLPTKVDFE